MKKQIVSISKLQTAKVVAVMYLFISLPFAMFSLATMWMSHVNFGAIPLRVFLGMPFLYAACGFVFTLVGAWIYNLVASELGGIEFTTADVADQ